MYGIQLENHLPKLGVHGKIVLDGITYLVGGEVVLGIVCRGQQAESSS